VADMAHTRQRTRHVLTTLLTGVMLLLSSAPALAHGEGDSTHSRVLIIDALTYLANRPPEYLDLVKDKVHDALDAPDKAGVDLSAVAAAQMALMADHMSGMTDMTQVRTLLQGSLLPLSGPVTGEQTGTTTMLDPLVGHTAWNASTEVFTAAIAVAMLLGLVLSYLWRPTESFSQLRRRLIEGEK